MPVGVVSEQCGVEPCPTKSARFVLFGHAPFKVIARLSNATLPAVVDMAKVPVASAEGNNAPCVPALASRIKKYCPGARSTLGKAVTLQLVPVAAVYCTVQPSRFTLTESALKISIKSF